MEYPYVAMKHMAGLDRQLKKGSTELLVLSLVENRARHGYEIGKLIETRSRGALRFNVASLYPLLYRLEAPRADRGPLGRKAVAAPAALLPADGRGPEDASRAAERLGGVRRSDAPDHGGRACLTGRTRSASGSRGCDSIPPARQSIVEEIAQHLDDRYAELLAQAPRPRRRSGPRSTSSPARRSPPRWPMRFRARRPPCSPPAEDGGSVLRSLQGPPLRRAAPASRAALRARRDPVARARHRRQHGDLPAPRRRAPAPPPDRAAARSSTTCASSRASAGRGNFSGALAAAHVRALGAHPRASRRRFRSSPSGAPTRLNLASGRRGAFRRTACG